MMLRMYLAVSVAAQMVWAQGGLSPSASAIYRVAILNDTSRSMPPGCDTVGVLAADVLAMPTLPGSTLMYFAIGDAQTAYEPRLEGTYHLPGTTRIFESKDFTREKQDILSQLATVCSKSRAVNVSAVFQGIKTVAEQLRSMGCGGGAQCVVLARTDGRDNANKVVRLALSGKGPSGVQLPIIDNNAINVNVCGLAQTKGEVLEADGTARTFSQPRSDRLEQVWSNLFSHSERLSIQPLCVSGTASTAPAKTRVALVTAANSPLQTAHISDSNGALRIMVPKDQARVGRQVRFQGDGALPQEMLVPVVRAGDEYWPQEVVRAHSDGSFGGSIIVGRPSNDCGQVYEFRLFGQIQQAVTVGVPIGTWPVSQSASLPIELSRAEDCGATPR